MDQKQKLITEYFTKQRCITANFEFEKFEMICSPLLSHHLLCNENCLNLQPKQCFINKDQKLVKQVEPLDLEQCFQIIKQRIILKQQKKISKEKLQIKLKRIKKQRHESLTKKEREKINLLQNLRFKPAVIAFAMNCSIEQVKKNNEYYHLSKCKNEIFFSQCEIQWIISQVKQESNSNLYSAKLFLNQFKQQFRKRSNVSLYQFRKLLHQLNINYITPEIKPLMYFSRDRKTEVIKFIGKYCQLLIQNYRFIFIDECNLGNISKHSHKQWHIKGLFKQQIHRISSYNCLMTAIGWENFIRYQIIQGTGKAFIFHDFLTQIISAATQHYGDTRFVIVLDNCTIHRAKFSTNLLGSIQYLYTPAYRPEFNGIEHLFGWLKRRISIAQPMIMSQFLFQIHRILNDTTNERINNWCLSSETHMYSFLSEWFQ